jgi:hypothetical protein
MAPSLQLLLLEMTQLNLMFSLVTSRVHQQLLGRTWTKKMGLVMYLIPMYLKSMMRSQNLMESRRVKPAMLHLQCYWRTTPMHKPSLEKTARHLVGTRLCSLGWMSAKNFGVHLSRPLPI